MSWTKETDMAHGGDENAAELAHRVKPRDWQDGHNANTLDPELQHSLEKMRRMLETSRNTGAMDCRVQVARYLRKQSERYGGNERIVILQMAADICEGAHEKF